MANIIDKNLFEQIFGHKLINTTNKEENKIIVNNIEKNKDQLYEKEKMSHGRDWVIQPSDRRIDLIDAIKLILNFNETI